MDRIDWPELPRNYRHLRGGRSTLVGALCELGYFVMPENALSVLQEQEQHCASRLSNANLQAFMEEVL